MLLATKRTKKIKDMIGVKVRVLVECEDMSGSKAPGPLNADVKRRSDAEILLKTNLNHFVSGDVLKI